METKNRRNKPTVQSITVTLILIVLALLCVTVVTLFAQPEDHGKTPVTDPAESINQPVTNKPDDRPRETDKPVIDQNPGDDTPVIAKPTWVMPVEGAQVSKKHDLTVLVFSQTMRDYRVHCGIDLQVPVGADVMSVADGIVKNIYTDPFEGTCISINHEGGYVSIYKNLATAVVEGLQEGSAVKAGQVIGSVGETAMIEISDEAHLHFELEKDQKKMDPLTVLPYDASGASFAE